ncbi:alpha/beta hydrolase [Candidatus Roizmanbacteria bacterium]|nr:alpha/beta hydrolase [Candidatus Roizmanbacteria bacterium]
MNDSFNNFHIQLKDGRKLGYAEFGDPKGKPVFYFHGWPASRLSGIETDTAAKKLGIRIIAPDRPGFGLSDFKKRRTLLDWPDDIVELADALKITKFAVMGCSGGGPYATACAYRLPARVTKAAIVVGLGPVNIPGNLDGISLINRISWGNNKRFPIVGVLASFGNFIGSKISPALSRRIGFGAKEDRSMMTNEIKERMNRSLREAFQQGIRGPAWDWHIYCNDWGFDLKDITVKTYLWYGAKDKNVSLNMGEYYHAQIPNSELHIDPHGGHLFRYKIEAKILQKLIT